MRLQDHIVKLTQRALDDVCRAALAVPPAFVDWSPGGKSRSALSQMRELAAADFYLPILRDRKSPNMSPKAMSEIRRQMERHATIEECVVALRTATSAICELISGLSDLDLEHEIELPFGGGQRSSMADVAMMHYWNLTYHLGQINQIHLILGEPSA